MSQSRASLDGVELKIKRAKKHLYDLEGMWRWFCETNPYGFVVEKDRETGEQSLVVNRADPLPLCIAGLAGDIVHNLRSALDQIIGQLIGANGRQPHNRAEFPIGNSESDYRSNKARKTQGISKEAADFLDVLKPYKGGNEPLWAIHHLDIVDKHRLLLTVAASHALLVLGSNFYTWDKSDPEAKIDPVAPLTEFVPRDPPALVVGARFHYDKDLQVTPLLALSEPGLGERKPLIPTLHDLTNFTALASGAFAEVIESGHSAATSCHGLNIVPPGKG
jgi:hypothetical protein